MNLACDEMYGLSVKNRPMGFVDEKKVAEELTRKKTAVFVGHCISLRGSVTNINTFTLSF